VSLAWINRLLRMKDDFWDEALHRSFRRRLGRTMFSHKVVRKGPLGAVNVGGSHNFVGKLFFWFAAPVVGCTLCHL